MTAAAKPLPFAPTARAEAAERYAQIGRGWFARFRVSLRKERASLTGCAWVRDRAVEAPWPSTTRKRLYILAHEIGHVALRHTRRLPRYVEEYEAEQFAHALMRETGVAVPRSMTLRAKRYVSRKIAQAHIRGLNKLDKKIAEWAGGKGAADGYTEHAHYACHTPAWIEAALSGTQSMTARTQIIWSERLQAHIRVEVPGTRGYDKHAWSFVCPAEERAYCLRKAASLEEHARIAKADAHWHIRQARVGRADGRRRHLVEHLTEARTLIRRAHLVGEQARLNGARAASLSGDTAKAAA